MPKLSAFRCVHRLGLLALFFVGFSAAACAQDALGVKANYVKSEFQIPMRDGVKLFTCVYAPKDGSQKYPILLTRTPYGVSPYGAEYKETIGPSPAAMREGFIFVYQDVRGRVMSEGEFVNMRPHVPKKASATEIDESTDTYDTIDWLVKNIPNNNGRVGMWGISYPGFYAAMGLVDAHPALKAVSPQAPIADWFIGDDFHHNGAFYLLENFSFFSVFGRPRPKPTIERPPNFNFGTPDAYRFFLDLGPIRNVDEKHFKGDIAFWTEATKHPNYDEYWKARCILPHLNKVKPAVLTVGGWFDAEDLYGPLHIYDTIERENPGVFNALVMGPWFHGGWARSDGDHLGQVSFGMKASPYYLEKIELPFFNFHLKDKGPLDIPEASIFETGANRWRSFDAWPPKGTEEKSLYLHANGKLSFDAPKDASPKAFDEYVSDPNKPVPFTAETTVERTREYMTEDQRFASRRPDVLVYETDVLAEDVTLAGRLAAELFVSTTGTDSDFIVKLIDVFPDTLPANENKYPMGGYQMPVRFEVMRAKFRDGFEKPEAMVPGKVTRVPFALQDVCHTFKKGHKIMIQVQSSWFPLVDRNPQKFTDIYTCKESDFQKATQRVYRSAKASSRLKVHVLNQ